MSFYVTLPSNSSMDLYPENTMTEFTTLLKEAIRLDVQYEVALVELTYKHSWSLEVGQLIIEPTNGGEKDIFKLIFHDSENILSFTNRLNGEIWKYFIKKEYDRRLNLGQPGQAITENIKIPNTPFNSSDRNEDVIDEIKSSVYFRSVPSFQAESYKFTLFPRAYRIKFEGDILKMLSLEDRWYQSSVGKRFIKSGIIDDTTPSLIHSLFLYCDIIDYQYVGDAYAPLLRSVVVDNNYLKTAWVHYDNPHYVRVNKNSISTIRVEIKDENGQKIRFENGKVIVKLHFRPRQYK